MRRAWIAMALLSGSWLFGLAYYQDTRWLAWSVILVAAVVLLTGFDIRKPGKGTLLTAAILAAPAVALAPWPYRAAPLLTCAGAMLWAAPIPRRWPERLGGACVTAGVILLAQSLGMFVYESVTARSHELPRGLAYLPYAVARLIGIDATLDGTTIALHSMRRVHYLGATWELMLDPLSWCFLIGGVVLLFLRTCDRSHAKTVTTLCPVATLLMSVALWLPARTGLLLAAYMHRALRTEYDTTLVLMNQFWNPWVLLFLLSGPALLAMRFLQVPAPIRPDNGSFRNPRWTARVASAMLVLIGTLSITTALFWVPSGPRKQGRILVDEHHSTWERTDRPYDVNWYGQESGYNYACIYDYCSRFYEMGRLDNAIGESTLDKCDVLVVKVPTSAYTSDEIDVIERFVEDGGSLLLIGEHTSVFNTGLHLNEIARRFGFRFRYDCLFDIDTPFNQLYRIPLAPHPILQNMPPLDFAVSCSIDPGLSFGRAVIRGTGLRSLPADYHASNFYPQVEDRAEARYGAFIQLWTTHHGAGRIAAFTDSTIFSNFSTFEPGKAELMLGMLEWLNHRRASPWVPVSLVALGILCAAWGFRASRRHCDSCLMCLSAAMLGWCVAVVSIRAIHQITVSPPQPVRPFTSAIIDRTVCSTPLSTSGFIATDPNGFGIFERWILRLGWFTSRRQDAGLFDGDIAVFLYPNGRMERDFRSALGHYVESGGKILVLDSPANSKSTANAIVNPFGLGIDHTVELQGTLSVPDGWPTTTVDLACEVKGGTPLIRLGKTTVAATATCGRGTVTAVGFGSRFSDTHMGVTGDVIPNEELQAVFNLEFRLLELIVPVKHQ